MSTQTHARTQHTDCTKCNLHTTRAANRLETDEDQHGTETMAIVPSSVELQQLDTLYFSADKISLVFHSQQDWDMNGRSYSSMDYRTPHKLRMYVQCCFTSRETVRTIRYGEPRTATSTVTQLLSSADIQVQCCFTSTETKRTIRNGEPRTGSPGRPPRLSYSS